MHLTILGGGPAGLATAYYAWRRNIPFALFERSETLGGLCRTFHCGQHSYDSGAHRFHDRDPEITNDLRELLPDELLTVSGSSKIYLSGRYADFPPTPLNLLFKSGIQPFKIVRELLRNRFADTEIRTFADLAVNRFGETLARTFLLNYCEKLWGLPADQLSPDVGTRRLGGMTWRSALKEVFFPGRRAEHLDGRFLYPRLGYGRIAEAMAALLPSDAVRTEHEVCAIRCEGRRISRVEFSGREAFDPPGIVLSTLPLSLLVRLLGEAAPEVARRVSAQLRFRHIRLIFLRVAADRVTSGASVYFPNPAFCISRVHEPKRRSAAMAPPGESSLVAEVPCFADDPLFSMAPADLTSRVISELQASGLLDGVPVIEWRHHFLANAYPVYSLDYAENVQITMASLAAAVDVETMGRNGLFRYGHLHDQLRMGRAFADNLACNKSE